MTQAERRSDYPHSCRGAGGRWFPRLGQSWTIKSAIREIRDPQSFVVPLAEAFEMAVKHYPSISLDPEIMAGAPCIADTRIPVYMFLDSLEYYGTLKGVVKSYPGLTLHQIKDAIGFAKLLVECPIDDETTTSA